MGHSALALRSGRHFPERACRADRYDTKRRLEARGPTDLQVADPPQYQQRRSAHNRHLAVSRAYLKNPEIIRLANVRRIVARHAGSVWTEARVSVDATAQESLQ